jgi:hypothetical protein
MKDSEISTPIKILILSDRLIHQAQILSDYLISTGFHVVALTKNKEQALIFCNQNINFLIIAGYLNDQQNYKVIEEYENRGIPITVVHWAMLDSLIADYCINYGIPLQFERTLPMSNFVLFLKRHNSLKPAPSLEELNIQCLCKSADKPMYKRFVYSLLGLKKNCSLCLPNFCPRLHSDSGNNN